jgi:hypothetical protein
MGFFSTMYLIFVPSLPFQTGSHCAAQASLEPSLELRILLPQPPECWD